MKILTVIGTRPQFIKASALSKKIQELERFKEVIIHTGQHYDENMSSIFFNQLSIPKPNYTLECGNKSHGEMTGLALQEIEKIILVEKPDYLLVYGDTNATLAGALAAAKVHVPVVHVEAGLRSHDFSMPEEINRVLTDSVSTILCVPSLVGKKNLQIENFPRYSHQKIVITGDIQFDSTLLFSNIKPSIKIPSDDYLVLTMHRPSNVDCKETMAEILSVLEDISKTFQIIFPIHPRTLNNIQKFNLDISFIKKLPPLGYSDMLNLIKFSSGVITDSGGLQKESYYLNKKSVVLRKNTEWLELVDCNASILRTNNTTTKDIISHLTSDTIPQENIYGDGHTAEKILNSL